jgi:hypothetical protein
MAGEKQYRTHRVPEGRLSNCLIFPPFPKGGQGGFPKAASTYSKTTKRLLEQRLSETHRITVAGVIQPAADTGAELLQGNFARSVGGDQPAETATVPYSLSALETPPAGIDHEPQKRNTLSDRTGVRAWVHCQPQAGKARPRTDSAIFRLGPEEIHARSPPGSSGRDESLILKNVDATTRKPLFLFLLSGSFLFR